MLKWHIQMVTFSADRKLLRFSIEAPDLIKAKQIVLQEFRKQSPGKKNLYLEAKSDGIYTIVSNLDDVGEVKIERVDLCE